MKISLPGDKNLVRQYLSELIERGEYIIKSSYFAALQEARALTGRDKDGRVIKEERTGCWSGTCVYFVLIDHISEFFIEQSFAHNGDRYIYCLETLGSLNNEDAKIIYKLRNSFLHKFNLYHKSKDGNYVFAVGRDPDTLIELAKQPWDGNFNNAVDQNHKTSVSLRKIQDLVENMNKNLLKSLEADDLFINLPQDTSLKNFLDFNTIAYKDIK